MGEHGMHGMHAVEDTHSLLTCASSLVSCTLESLEPRVIPRRLVFSLLKWTSLRKSFAVIWEDRGRDGEPPLKAQHTTHQCAWHAVVPGELAQWPQGDGGTMDSVRRTPSCTPSTIAPTCTSYVVFIQRSREA